MEAKNFLMSHFRTQQVRVLFLLTFRKYLRWITSGLYRIPHLHATAFRTKYFHF